MAKFREVADQLCNNVAGIRAIVLLGPEGAIMDYMSLHPGFDIETFGHEYAMLLRIARRTSEDVGSGDLTEHIAVSAESATIARCLASEHSLILVFNSHDQIGRARYELKRAARSLQVQDRR